MHYSVSNNRRSTTRNVTAVVIFLFIGIGIQSTRPKAALTNDQTASEPSSSAQGIEGATGDGQHAVVLQAEADKLRSEQRRDSYASAVKKYDEAGQLWRAANEFEKAAVAFRCAAEVLQILGETRRTLSVYTQALELTRKAKSKSEEGKVLNGMAYAHFLEGNAAAAKENSLAALKIATTISDRRMQAQGLSNLGEAYYNFGDIATAEKYQQESLELWRELDDKSGQALASVALGYYQSFLGQPLEALKLFKDGLSSAESANDRRTQALALNGIANITAKMGNKQEALDSYARAQTLVEQIGDQVNLASILGGMGSLYFWMGDAQKALGFLERSVAIFEDIGQRWGVAEAKLDLGRIRRSLGDHKKALETLLEALALFKALQMRRVEAHVLREIGLVQTALGDLQNARNSFEQALKLTRTGQDHRHEAYTLIYLGKMFEELKNPNQALTSYRHALSLSKVAADPAVESNALFNIARIERNEGKLLQAQKDVEAAITLDELIRTKVSSLELRASYFATVRAAYELYIDILMLKHKANPREGFDVQAFGISERGRARSFLESLYEAQANVREGVDPDLLAKERSLNERLNEKAEQHLKSLARKDTAKAEMLRKEIDALTLEYAELRDRIRASNPRYAALTQPQPLNFKEVQEQVLRGDTILLEYALGDDRSYLWMVTRDGLSSYQLQPKREIEQSANRLYGLFVDFQPIAGESLEQTTERQRTAAESIPGETRILSELILGPLAGKLGNRRLIIIPDGSLQYIPFQALNDPDSPSGSTQLLVKSHEIVNDFSASTLAVLLKEASGRTVASKAVAVFADPVFEVDDPRVRRASTESTPQSEESLKVQQALRDIGLSPDGVEIPRLFASGDEADAIIDSVPWGTGLKAVGFGANRERVLKQDLADYRVVHFATHGLINNEHPELSGIVFSLFDEQGRSQDGFLRLHDIYNMRLPADLVVLSACSTGLGKDVKGEGLIGLTRGFMYAGASSVIASLWKVDDAATAELMKHFYEAMFGKGLTPAAALRDAQLVMSRDQRWQSPYFWAGFVIQGRYDQEVAPQRLMLLTLTRVAVTVGLLVLLILTIVLIALRRRRA